MHPPANPQPCGRIAQALDGVKKNEEGLADDDMKRRDKEVSEGNLQPNAMRTQHNTPGSG